MPVYLNLGNGLEYLSACLETGTASEDKDAISACSLGSGTVAPVSLGGTSPETLRATCNELTSAALVLWYS